VFVDNQSVYELIPDRLYRVGCTVKAERLSWLPADLQAFEPLNCYLLIDGDLAFFVDTGMAISEPAVGLAMQEIVRERDIHVTFTRNEADCIGNLGFVLGTAEEPTLMFGGVGGILEWINDPSAAQLETRDFLDKVPVEQVASPTRNNYGDLTLRWLDAGVKEMFLTQWVFEEKTGCLFTSDTYGFRHLNSSQATPVIESVRNLPSVDAVAREFAERINWLPGSHYPEVIARLKSIFAELDVQMIAPVHGCVLKGRDVVAAHVDLSIKALEAAAALPA
jgi:flavorubredoxin